MGRIKKESRKSCFKSGTLINFCPVGLVSGGRSSSDGHYCGSWRYIASGGAPTFSFFPKMGD